MKQILVLFFGICISLSSYAQHLSVKGVEIFGSASSFIDKIRQKGFVSVNANLSVKEATALKGIFAGVNNSYIIVYHDDDVISQVVVMLEGNKKWADAKKEYHDFKYAYEEKYKVEPISMESFKNPEREYSGFECSEFIDGRAKYTSSFDIENGVITLSITPILRLNDMWDYMNYSNGFITTITYVNKADAEILRQRYMEDL